jgi:hypothetical protein
MNVEAFINLQSSCLTKLLRISDCKIKKLFLFCKCKCLIFRKNSKYTPLDFYKKRLLTWSSLYNIFIVALY